MATPRSSGMIPLAPFVFFGLLVANVHALATSPESDLIALSDAWIRAEVAHDRAALEGLLDDRFVAIDSKGQTLDRAAFIDRIMGKEIKPFEVVNEVVNVHDDTGLVVSSTMDHTLKFTWVAVKKAGQWRVISETFSKVAAPG